MGCLRRTLWPSTAAELHSTLDIDQGGMKEVLRAHNFDHQSQWFINASLSDHADSDATSIISLIAGKKNVTNALDTCVSHDLFI